MPISEDKLLNIVNTEFSTSKGIPGQAEAKARDQAWDRYMQLPTGDEVEGESEATTSDVSDVVDSLMPSMLRIFTTADNLVSFDPHDGDDIAAAEQETDTVSFVFFKENDAFMLMFYWMFDALLAKLGVVKAWWDISEQVTQESYENLTIEDVAEMLEEEELEPFEREENDDGTHNLKFRRINKTGKVTVEPVPPSEYRISQDANHLDPGRARMVGQERDIARTDLVDMGFDPDMVAGLDAVSPNKQASGETAVSAGTGNTATADKSQELVRVREAYLRVDYDEDGRAELRQIFTANDKLLRWKDGKDANMVVDRQPFHVLCAAPLPHRHFGLAPGEKMVPTQLTTTTLLRQVLMNLYHTNKPGHGVWEGGMSENTLDDLLTTRVGAVRRFKRPVSESYAPMTVPFTAGATFPMLEYFEKVKRDRTGVSSDSEGLSPEALKNIQQSVMAAATDLGKMKIEAIARIFAETGFKTLFRHIHELLQKHQNKAKVVRLRGGEEFVAVNPTEWRTRENMTVNIGLGVGTREQNLLHLDAIWQKQGEMATGGGMNLTVTPQNMYNTAKEFVKNANLKNPALFFTDPGDQPAPPPADEQQELEKMQAELKQREQFLDEQRQQINIGKLELDRDRLELTHQRDMLNIEEKSAAREDKFAIENEKLRNRLLEMGQEAEDKAFERGLKERESQSKDENLAADTQLKRAAAVKTITEAQAQDIENDAAETGVNELIDELAFGSEEPNE